MTPMILGAFGSHLGQPQTLSLLQDELASEELAGLARQFDHVLVSDESIWSSAAAAAQQALAGTSAAPDLIVVVTQNDPDTTTSGALLAARLGLGTVPRISISGHECGNLGPALQVVCDALTSGRATCVLLVVADHAVDGSRVMRNRMGFFSDGAAACLVARADAVNTAAFTPRWSVDDIVVLGSEGSPGQPVDLETSVTLIRSAVGLLGQREEADSVLFAHYRADSRTFLHAATGLRSAVLLAPPASRSGHVFGADHLLALANSPPGVSRIVAVLLGPWSVSALFLRRVGRTLGHVENHPSTPGSEPLSK